MVSVSYPRAMRKLIHELSRLPTIGEKSAVRLAHYLVADKGERSTELANAILEAGKSVKLCRECFFFSDEDICTICSDPQRTRSIICVVEKPADVIALERAGGFHGLYHVLHGLWSPLRGIAPEQTRLTELLSRARDTLPGDPLHPHIEELILATGMTVEGDATALYILRQVEAMGIQVTRIAQGLPKGGELEYADELTLSHALEGRRPVV